MVYKSSQLNSGGPGGTVTQINTGTGLTGGPITASGTISIASNAPNTLAGFDNTGNFSDVAVGAGLSLSSGTLISAGSGGTVTTTGSPATGALVAFSGPTSIANGNLSGDISTSGALTTTLATVNTNTGTFGSASSVAVPTVNGKGLITAINNTAIQITESQVTNLVSNLAAKQATITLTTTGTSGAATFVSNTLNIPQYATTSLAFSGLTSGTNTAAAMLVGSGASLATTGTGTITATTVPANGITGTTLPSGIVSSSLTSVGTITTGTWRGTIIDLAHGGTGSDLSATGGVSQVLKQVSAGAAITVGQLAASDLTNGTTGTGAVVLAGSPTITTAVLGSSTATTQTPGDNSTKLATTAYVQAAVFGTTPVGACKYATTAALTATYNNGASGVGATLAGVALGALTVDGVTPSVADRILVKNQASTFQNGIYVVTTVGNVGVAYVLTRASDYNQSTDIDIGDTTFISAGSTLANTTWTQNGTEDPVVGTDPITFTQTAGPGSYTAGNGITITGTSIAIDTAITVDKTTAQTLSNKTFVGPALGTPISGVATNLTGTAAGLTAGTVTTNANLTGVITSVGNATSIASQTGTGTKFVVDTSPTLVTPVIGAATGTSLSVSGQLTSTVAIGTAPLVVTSTTLVPNLYVARAVIADSATTNANLTGPITSIGNATSIASQTGTGTKFVVDTSPTLVTPALGVATGTSLALGGATIGANALAITGTSALAGQLALTQPTANTIALSVSGYSLTGTNTQSLANFTGTWNTSGIAQGLFVNITDTASGTGSKIFDFQTNSASKLSLDRTGSLLALNNITATQSLICSGGNIVATIGSVAINNNNGTYSMGSAGDVRLTRGGAATLLFGAADAAAPVAQTTTVQSVVAGTADTAGANWTFNGSKGTGTGAGGSIIFRTAPASTTGSTQNALVTALTLASSGAATFVSTVASTGLNLSGLTASSAVATDASKNLVSVTNTGSGNNVLATSPTLVTPVLGAASATSINFGGTSLGVYAEGTFTPAIAGSATVGVGTYSVQTGQYTRIGNRVDFTAALTWSAHTGTGNMVMTGLPFTSVANVAVSFLNGSIASTASTFISLLIPSSNSVVEFFTITISTGAIGFQPIDTAAAIFISGTYFV